MKDIVLFGDGRTAETFYHYLTQDSDFRVVAFTVDRAHLNKDSWYDLPVVPFEEVTTLFSPARYGMIVAVSYHDLNKLRADKVREAKAKGYRLESYVSSRASNIAGVAIGDNCFIMENVVLQPCCTIGNNVHIWSGCHIGHHSRIADHCFLASHVVVSGGAVIGPYTFIGVNATIRPDVQVGAGNIIGACSNIARHTQDHQVFMTKPTEAANMASETFLRLVKL